MPTTPMRPQWLELTDATTGERKNFNFDLEACNSIEPGENGGTVVTTHDGDTFAVSEAPDYIRDIIWPAQVAPNAGT